MDDQKHVVVLAHADAWGAQSANTLLRHLHEHHPDIGVFLVLSRATKNADGDIATKLDDLKIIRAIRETNVMTYFDRLDTLGLGDGDLLTFTQLAARYCRDGVAHYTSQGGLKGGKEVAAIFDALAVEHGVVPEVVLSVDTMAILPGEIVGRIPCFSTHPGPLDSIKIEGMQGTLRSHANQVFTYPYGPGLPCIQGTLFLQHEELDKGPLIDMIETPTPTGMCAHQMRDEVYGALVDKMIERLPDILDADCRAAMIEKALADKAVVDAQPVTRIAPLEEERLRRWQNQTTGFLNDDAPNGVEVIQNQLMSRAYFEGQMRRFMPQVFDKEGNDAFFKGMFDGLFSQNFARLAAQEDARLDDPWARFYAGKQVTIKRYDPKTGDVIATFSNP